MTWQQLKPMFLNSKGFYQSLELTETSGTVHLLMPKFPANAVGRYEVGLFGGTKANPQFVEIKKVLLAPFDRYISIDYPPALPGPLLGLRLLGQGGGSYVTQPRYTTTSVEDCMAFYDLTLEQLEESVNQELAKRIETVDEIPNHADHSLGDQFIYSATGETITLGKNNRWLGDLVEVSESAIAPGLDGLAANGSAALDPVSFFDFDGGPERYYEAIVLSNASTVTTEFDMVVPAHDENEGVFAELTRTQSMQIDIEAFSFQLQEPEIHLAASGSARRVSLTVRYRNTYQFVEPAPEFVSEPAPDPQ